MKIRIDKTADTLPRSRVEFRIFVLLYFASFCSMFKFIPTDLFNPGCFCCTQLYVGHGGILWPPDVQLNARPHTWLISLPHDHLSHSHLARCKCKHFWDILFLWLVKHEMRSSLILYKTKQSVFKSIYIYTNSC